MDYSEKRLEDAIESGLLSGPPGRRYQKRSPDDYDRTFCLIPRDAIDFIYATQPKEWEKFKKIHGAEAKERLTKRLASEVERRGTLDVLRKGIKSDGCKFQLAYFRPASGLNEQLQKLYDGNLFSVVRQLRYSLTCENSLDLGLFL